MATPRNMHREDIKAAIRKRGITLENLSLREGLAKFTIIQSLRRPIPRANIAIAQFLGMALHDIWPSWYDREGNRKSHHKATAKPRPRHRKKSPRNFTIKETQP